MTAGHPKSSLASVIVVWSVIIWGLGVWRHWWEPGLKSIAIGGSILVFLIFMIAKGVPEAAQMPPHAYAEQEAKRLEQGQVRLLRHLQYRACSDWENERSDGDIWAGVRFRLEPLRLFINVHVRWIGDREDTSPEGLQAYAKKHYEQQLGHQLIKNELSHFLGRRCVVSEATVKGPDGKMAQVRRLSFVIQGSEYGVQFTSGDEELFAASEPVISAFLGQCRLVFPNLVERTVFNGRMGIGMPPEAVNTENEGLVSLWESAADLLSIKLYLLESAESEVLERDILDRVPSYIEKKDFHMTRYRMEEYGLAILSYSSPGEFHWSMEAVKMPTGPAIIIEFDHRLYDKEDIQGFLFGPFRRAMIGSLRDLSIPII